MGKSFEILRSIGNQPFPELWEEDADVEKFNNAAVQCGTRAFDEDGA